MWARIAVLTGLLALAFASPASATHGPNVFSGSWSTNIGTISFAVISEADGAPALQSLGGQACPAPTVYYQGYYQDSSNTGGHVVCTRGQGRVVGRYVENGSSSTHGDGGLDLNFVAPNQFSGFYTGDDFPGMTFTYTGTYQAHLDGDGCCPGTPSPAPGGDPPPSGSPQVLPAATVFGQASPPTALPPGGTAIGISPVIPPGLREISYTTTGDAEGQTSPVAVTKPRTEDGLTRGDCMFFFAFLAADSDPGGFADQFGFDDLPPEFGSFLTAYIWMSVCFDLVEEQNATATLAQSSCRPRSLSLSGRVNRAAGTVRYRYRRTRRRSPSRRLRVTCQRAGDGTVTMRIRTRSRRTKLRKVVGRRLVVGLRRAPDATGTANVQSTFTHP